MTWHTPCGDRVLRGTEAEIMRQVIGVIEEQLQWPLYDDEDSDDSFKFGMPLLDSLSLREQIALFKQVEKYLLTQTPSVLDLNAFNESAVYAILEKLKEQISTEVDSSEWGGDIAKEPVQIFWRTRMLAYYFESYPETAEQLRLPSDQRDLPSWIPDDHFSTNLEQWEFLVETLTDGILWDLDFELAGVLMDIDPDIATAIKRDLNINQDYFISTEPSREL